jgi:hypothetical protein
VRISGRPETSTAHSSFRGANTSSGCPMTITTRPTT